MSALVCPRCGESISSEDCVWIYQQKFYCSENCARLAQGMTAR